MAGHPFTTDHGGVFGDGWGTDNWLLPPRWGPLIGEHASQPHPDRPTCASDYPQAHSREGGARMSGQPRACDVVVVGAGLAGLAAATHLQAAGLDVVVLEASDGVGGRVRTDIVDGYRLDRGFQLYNPSYPEGQRMFDYAELDLRPFERGARVVIGEHVFRLGDPRSHPTWALDALRAPLGGWASLARFLAYAVHCATTDPTELQSRPDEPIAAALTNAGVAPATLARFVQPFLAGVFLENDLATSRRFADLILRSFVRGTPTVPSRGMQALPQQLAAGLANVQLHTTVTSVHPRSVQTDQGPLQAKAVIVAVDPASVNKLLPAVRTPRTHSCTTWYFSPDQPPGELSDGLALLTLDGESRGPLINTAVMSHAAPSYAPPGHSLVAGTAVGSDDTITESAVRAHLARLYGVPTDGWACIKTFRIDPALPAMDSPLNLRQPADLGDGLFVAGDHRDTASIQGALVSGRRAAASVRRWLGVGQPAASNS